MEYKWCVRTLSALGLLCCLWPQASHAQPCHSEALDALATAQRARSFQLDFERYEQFVATRLEQLYSWLEEDGQQVGWSTQLVFFTDSYKFSDWTLCTPEGQKQAQLDGGWYGIAIGTRNRNWRTELRLLVFSSGDNVAPDDLPYDEQGNIVFDGDAIGYGKTFLGGHLKMTEWFSATLGGVWESERLQHIGTRTLDDGTIETSNNVHTNLIGEPSWYFSPAIPAWGVSGDFVADASGGFDLGIVRVRSIPIPWLEGLAGAVGAGYLAYEETPIVQLGARYRSFRFIDTSLELAFEPVRLRSAVARIEADWSQPYFFDAQLVRDPLRFLLALEAGAFAEASLYNSERLEQETDHANLPGVVAGASFGLLTRMAGFNLQFYGGINPAHHLARVVDVVDKPLFGMRVLVRFGY